LHFIEWGCLDQSNLGEKQAESIPNEPDQVILVREDEKFQIVLFFNQLGSVHLPNVKKLCMKLLNGFLLFCTVFLPYLLAAQQVLKVGTVLDFDQSPLPSVSVFYERDGEKTRIAITDFQGRFDLTEALADDDKLIFDGSLLGYGSAEMWVADFQEGGGVYRFGSGLGGDYSLSPLTVFANWAQRTEPFTSQNLSKKELNQYNFGNDFPTLLQFETSVVHTSDAGAGVGYTGLRIRGSDATRINVTINGVPYNDSESQGVFWVNISDIAASATNTQIQRGVGPSTNGVGSFGASVNLSTLSHQKEPSQSLEMAYGSFHTFRRSLSANTGALGKNGRFNFNGRYSKITSNGFIDRASSDLSSYYMEGAYLGKNWQSRWVLFGGQEVTYQAWNGVPFQFVQSGGALRTFNTSGQKGDGTTYADQVDNYQQNHLHWINTFSTGQNSEANLTFHYTKGRGFYEEYRVRDRFNRYGLPPVEVDGVLVSRGDLIRRRWLDNDFAGLIFNHTLQGKNRSQTVGGGVNYYEGQHFGEVLWSQISSNYTFPLPYYDNLGKKWDANVFMAQNFSLGKDWFAFADLQLRRVDFAFEGISREREPLDQTVDFYFFNPKIGLTRLTSDNSRYYLSLAVANKEPNRRDFVDAPPGNQPKPEQLYNLETGFEKNFEKLSVKANLYGMYYRDQLVLNGLINDVGAFTRVNLDKSYRAGLEAVFAYQWTSSWKVYGNTTLSRNRVLDFENYVDVWDDGSQRREFFASAPIAFSPDFLAATGIEWRPHFSSAKQRPWVFSLDYKFVGRQFLDNTGDVLRSLDPYHFGNFRAEYEYHTQAMRLVLFGAVNNFMNQLFSSNGWVYAFDSEGYNPVADNPYVRALSESRFAEIGLFPQAGRHFSLGVNVYFTK
jgi:iron complex outermembrane recepter protein